MNIHPIFILSCHQLKKDWSLSELLGVCSLLSIPFVVIVQAHLLKDKGSVRLRKVLSDDLEIGWHVGSSGANERFVTLQDLGATIREMSVEGGRGVSNERAIEDPKQEATNSLHTRDLSTSRAGTAEVECFYVDQDQYFSEKDNISKSDKPHWKGILKAMKSVAQRSELYLSSQLSSSGPTPVFAVADLSFWVLRDFGTSLMRRERKDQSAMGACLEITEKYPKGKRPLKALAMAIDYFMKRRGLWDQSTPSRHGSPQQRGGSQLLNILFYSKLDDRFDLVSFEN